jgi:4-phytase/acid phosphatase
MTLKNIVGLNVRVVAAVLLGVLAVPVRADQLRLAVILTRHGVRSPLQSGEALASLADKPWPAWETAKAGDQTPHGNQLVAAMGDFYRARFLAQGVLSGNASADAPLVYLRADNDERTIETARILGKALAPVGDPEVHTFPGNEDPLFRPYGAGVGEPDRALACASILGRLGGDATAVDRIYADRFAELRAVLFPSSPAWTEATSFQPGTENYLVKVKGPLASALVATDVLELEYADGKPLSEVGWGRVDGKRLADLTALNILFFDLTQRTLYPAQVNGSNLASHLVDTFEQAALEDSVPGALGAPGSRVVVLAGHDTNIANIGGLFSLDWTVPGLPKNPTVPGGALLFELWRKDGTVPSFYIRASYVAQTLEQMREGGSGAPSVSPIFIPGCSGSSPTYDAPLDAFVRQARTVINRHFLATDL